MQRVLESGVDEDRGEDADVVSVRDQTRSCLNFDVLMKGLTPRQTSRGRETGKMSADAKRL